MTTRNMRKELCLTHGIKWFQADQVIRKAQEQCPDDEDAVFRVASDMAANLQESEGTSGSDSKKDLLNTRSPSSSKRSVAVEPALEEEEVVA